MISKDENFLENYAIPIHASYNLRSITNDEFAFIDETAARVAVMLGLYLGDYERRVRKELLMQIRSTGSLMDANATSAGLRRNPNMLVPMFTANAVGMASTVSNEAFSTHMPPWGTATATNDKPTGFENDRIKHSSNTFMKKNSFPFIPAIAGGNADEDPIMQLRTAIRQELAAFQQELLEAEELDDHPSTTGGRQVPSDQLSKDELQHIRNQVPVAVWKEYGFGDAWSDHQAKSAALGDKETDEPSANSPGSRRARRPTRAAAPQESRSRSAARRSSQYPSSEVGSRSPGGAPQRTKKIESPSADGDAFGTSKRGSVAGAFSRSSSMRKVSISGRRPSIALSIGGQSLVTLGDAEFPLPPESGTSFSAVKKDFIQPSDLLPFFSFRQRDEDSKQLSKALETALKSLRAQRLELVSGAYQSASNIALTPPDMVSSSDSLRKNESNGLDAPSSSGSMAAMLATPSTALSAQKARSNKLHELKQLEKAIADAEKLLDDIAAETLEHEDARAAMLRCANTEARSLELELAAIENKIKTAAPYCDFLAQQTLATLKEMNTGVFDEAKYEMQQKHITPADMFARYAQRAGNTHADNAQQVTNPTLSSNFAFTLQILRAMGIRDAIIDGELTHIWRLAQLSSHCERVMGKLVRCQRCGRGSDALDTEDQNPEAAINDIGAGGNASGSEQRKESPTGRRSLSSKRSLSMTRRRSPSPTSSRPKTLSQSRHRKPKSVVEFYTLLPCGHDHCGQCMAQMDVLAGEGAPRQCAVCGELSFLTPVPNVALTAIAQRLRFQRAGIRDLEAAATQFQQTLALQEELDE